jgi:Secretion system C-terminal sorting domain
MSSTIATTGSCSSSTGTIDITGTGGTGSYRYAWSPDGGNTTTQPVSNTGLYTISVNSGTYTITITDATSACSVSTSATVSGGMAILGDVNNASCTSTGIGTGSGDILNFGLTGGVAPFTYTWTDPSGASFTLGTNNNLPSLGTYNVTVTDANSCTATRAFTRGSYISASVGQTNVNLSDAIHSGLILDDASALNTGQYILLAPGTTLTIDKNIPNHQYHFVNTEIVCMPGSEIVIEPTDPKITARGTNILFVTHCDLHGCDAMWKGIRMKDAGATFRWGNGLEDGRSYIGMSNTSVRDAVYAIQQGSTTESVIKDNTFTNNVVGLYIPIWNSDRSLFSLTHGNTFATDVSLHPFLPTGGLPTERDLNPIFNIISPMPLSSEVTVVGQSWTGIYVQGVNSLTVGSQSQAPNNFINCVNGIVAIGNDALTVNNNSFTNILSDVYAPNTSYAPNPFYPIASNGVYFNGIPILDFSGRHSAGSLTCRPNLKSNPLPPAGYISGNFTNCGTAILCERTAAVNVRNTSIDAQGYLDNGSWVGKRDGIVVKSSENSIIDIRENAMSNINSRGIQIAQCEPILEMKIQDNIIGLGTGTQGITFGTMPRGRAMGIDLAGRNLAPAQGQYISCNLIDMYHDASIGINANSLLGVINPVNGMRSNNPTNIATNAINFVEQDDATTAGIAYSNTQLSSFGNRIQAPLVLSVPYIHANNTSPIGEWHNASVNHTYDEDITQTGIGIRFTGVCSGGQSRNELLGAQMNTHHIGLLVDNTATIDQQNQIDNCTQFGIPIHPLLFWGDYTSTFAAQNKNSQGYNGMIITTYTSPSYYTPNTPGIASVDPQAWFKSNGGTGNPNLVAPTPESYQLPNCNIGCALPITDPTGGGTPQLNALQQAVINDEISLGNNYDESVLWQLQQDVFNLLQAYPALRQQGSAEEDFYNAYLNSGIDLYAQLATSISTAQASGQGNIAAYGSLLRVKDSLLMIHQIQMDQYAQLTLATDIAIKRMAMHKTDSLVAIADSLLHILKADIDSTRKLEAQPLLAINDGLTAENQVEQNLQDVNHVYLKTIALNNYHLDASQRAEITSIANQCPLLGGSGVFYARSIRTLWENITYNNDSICNATQGQSFKRKLTSNRHKTASIRDIKEVSVYPNPATTEIYIRHAYDPDGQYRLRLIDMSGREVMTDNIRFTQSVMSESVGHLVRGLYMVMLTLDGKSVYSGRVLLK